MARAQTVSVKTPGDMPVTARRISCSSLRAGVGDFLGAYTLGSGASWEKGTDYTDPEQRRRMKEAQLLQKSIEVGDEVLLTSGIIGFIDAIDGDVLWVEED